MRGCVSAGMIASVVTLGLMDTFDAVYGSSAGSLVGAYAIAGQVGCCGSCGMEWSEDEVGMHNRGGMGVLLVAQPLKWHVHMAPCSTPQGQGFVC